MIIQENVFSVEMTTDVEPETFQPMGTISIRFTFEAVQDAKHLKVPPGKVEDVLKAIALLEPYIVRK